jgi:membrane protein
MKTQKIVHKKIPEIWVSVKSALKEMFTENTMHMAASLSYTSLLALVPLVVVVLSMFSLFPVFADWSEQLQQFIYENMVPIAGDVIKNNIDNFAGQAGKLTAMGLIFLTFTALMMLSTIEDSLNKIWRVDKGRALGQRIIVYWTMLTLGPLLLGAGLSLTSYLAASEAFDFINIGGAATAALTTLPFLFETAAFILAYILMPNCKVRLSHALIGGLVASLLFQFAKKSFALYVSKFNTYEVIYGALATLPIFLIWIFVGWVVFLLGAQIAAGLGHLSESND